MGGCSNPHRALSEMDLKALFRLNLKMIKEAQMATEKKINSRIQQKHDVAANWAKATNFIPQKGEIIIYDAEYNASGSETQAVRFKIGDGTRTVNNLPFAVIDYNNRITALESKPGLDKVGTVTSVKANGTNFNPDATGKVDLGNLGGGSGPLTFADVVVMTEAEFSEAYLAGTLQDDKLYLIEGETGTVNFVSTADHIVYNNANSGLTATNLQGAVDEMCQRLLTTAQLNKLIALLDKLTVANDSVTFNTIVKATTFDVQ
jgi:hypothetical protein